ncbi:hypothetical protein FF38_01004 [Lucilia cuprina]|uniref:Uncharacterized protein n=1 Tax=Lucilia cuprina TaxID=7375 RepID=A0A0L0BVD6_LUCCU|nr:hypothetical protein FF38_01004 [Lucilia cuprina]
MVLVKDDDDVDDVFPWLIPHMTMCLKLRNTDRTDTFKYTDRFRISILADHEMSVHLSFHLCKTFNQNTCRNFEGKFNFHSIKIASNRLQFYLEFLQSMLNNRQNRAYIQCSPQNKKTLELSTNFRLKASLEYDRISQSEFTPGHVTLIKDPIMMGLQSK